MASLLLKMSEKILRRRDSSVNLILEGSGRFECHIARSLYSGLGYRSRLCSEKETLVLIAGRYLVRRGRWMLSDI